mmetsp:Transcript_23150/g.32620  ORF Transcript_23150/g.32620 Transcript_23150/m.32620 type:complete len:87 (-) Transcript_23150:1709-1969(-)
MQGMQQIYNWKQIYPYTQANLCIYKTQHQSPKKLIHCRKIVEGYLYSAIVKLQSQLDGYHMLACLKMFKFIVSDVSSSNCLVYAFV